MTAELMARLPRKRMAAAGLILDQQRRVLLVEPTYRPDWLLPGGSIEEDETPLAACQRELAEELGLVLPIQQLLCVDYQSRRGVRTEILQLVFFGGVLDQQQQALIRLPVDELRSFRFVSLSAASTLVNELAYVRVQQALAALDHGGVAYLENGSVIGTGSRQPHTWNTDA